jgi:hypothetical protein
MTRLQTQCRFELLAPSLAVLLSRMMPGTAGFAGRRRLMDIEKQQEISEDQDIGCGKRAD